MTAFRVLVADKVKAQLYDLPSRRGRLRAVEAFVNPAGMQPERALASGPAGRMASGTSSRRQTYEPKHTIREHADEVFVKQVAAAVAADVGRNEDKALILVATPRLVAAYRRRLPGKVRDRIAAEIRSDLTKLPMLELNRRVRAAVGTVPIAVSDRLSGPATRRRTRRS